MDVFLSFALVLGVASVVALFAQKTGQPLLLAYIAAGIGLGIIGIDGLEGSEYLHLMSEVAIAVLLFTVGLELNADELTRSGRASLVVGLTQMTVLAAVGFCLAVGLGYPLSDSVYISIAVTFSSTIVVIKMLSDKGELDSLHGRISIGVLIVQDIAVIVVMLILSAMDGVAGGDSATLQMVSALGLGLGLVVAAILVGRFAMPSIMGLVAKSSELMILFCLAWALTLAAAGDAIGLGKELGAFVAGLSLANSPFKDSIMSRLIPLRNFFLVFFFMDLGMSIDFGGATALIPNALIFAAVITFVTPLTTTFVMGKMGYHRMTGFFTGLSISQISEFSLILMGMGISSGAIEENTQTMITIVTIITIVSSTYLMRYSGRVYGFSKNILRIFQRGQSVRGDGHEQFWGDNPAVIILGMGHYGSKLANGLQSISTEVLGVDSDPDIVSRDPIKNVTFAYADFDDPDLADYLPLESALIIVNTLSPSNRVIKLEKSARDAGFTGTFFTVAETDDAELELHSGGVKNVFNLYDDAAGQAVRYIKSYCQLHETAQFMLVDGELMPKESFVAMHHLSEHDGVV